MFIDFVQSCVDNGGEVVVDTGTYGKGNLAKKVLLVQIGIEGVGEGIKIE